MKIGNKIKELRKARGITQEQLANSIGVSFQAVSKWENEITLPDIALAPSLAAFFGVTMDELFDYDLQKTTDAVMGIVRKTWPLRKSDPEKGKQIIYDGLKQYPENDILLENLLYLQDETADPDGMIETALRTIDATTDDAIRYDALRFLARAYKAKNDLDSARASLMRIPEVYFSRLSEMANVLTGEEKRIAAEKQIGVSLELLCEMQLRRAEDMTEKGQFADAKKEYERISQLLDLFDATGNAWDSYRKRSANKIEELEGK